MSYCCVVCAFGFGFCRHLAFFGSRGWCACSGWGLCAHPATVARGPRRVCLDMAFAAIPPFLAGVHGVCIWVRVVPQTYQFWLVLLMCVFAYRLSLNPANRGGGFWCVFGYRFCFTLAFPDGGLSRVSSGMGFRLNSVNPGWGLWRVFLGSGFRRNLAIPGLGSWLVFGYGVCLHLAFAGGELWPVCLGTVLFLTPQILAGD